MRRAPVWVTGSGAELAAVQYRPSAYSNPMRVILRGPLGYRTRLIAARTRQSEASRLHARHERRARGRPLPLRARDQRSRCAIAERVRAFQSGRLSAYLLYMLIALIVALALVPILR